MSPLPRPTFEIVLDPGDTVDTDERLRFARSEIVIVVNQLLDGAVSDATVERVLDRFDELPQAALIVGVVIDAETGQPWDLPGGLALTGHPLPPTPAPSSQVPTLVPGGFWAVRRAALEAVGGLDAQISAPAASIDLAWRLWLLGHEVVLDPSLSVAGPMAASAAASIADPVTREVDALRILYLNLDSWRRDTALPIAKALSPVRLREVDPVVDPSAGVRRFEAQLGAIGEKRHPRQVSRRRPDVDLLVRIPGWTRPDRRSATFVDAHASAIGTATDLGAFNGRWRITVATADSLTSRMAGPAIRALRVATELAMHHEVRLVSLTTAEISRPDMTIESISTSDIDGLLEWSDIFFFQGWVLAGNLAAATCDTILVADIYDPLHLEQLEQTRDDGEFVRRHAVRHATAVLNEQLLRGDFFLCASPKQRDLWLGGLAALGRLNPATYDSDPSLASLVAVVPFGISDAPPVQTAPALKGVIPGIADDDHVVLWGGGVYNWFDPLSLIRAVDRLRHRVPTVRLVFLGMQHPNPEVPEMRVAQESRRLAEELDLTDKHVFFNEGWVPFDERQNYLLDADVAITTHFDHVETEFSFRTRVLDYLWAGIPTVATCGDSLADLIEARGLGITVPPGDVGAIEDALHRLLTDGELAARCRQNIAATAPGMRWDTVLEPLVRFCAEPHRAPDIMERLVDPLAGPPLLLAGNPTASLSMSQRFRRDLRLTRDHLRHGGAKLVLARASSRLRTSLSQLRT